MANEELGKLSPEQIQKLASTISEAKSLTSQQEEIIKRVLAGEIEIGNTRIASLEKYFDIYSKSLDMVARKHSAMNDAFLILEHKLTENYKTLSSDVAKLEEQLTKIAKTAQTSEPSAEQEKSVSKRKTKQADVPPSEATSSIANYTSNKESSNIDLKALTDAIVDAIKFTSDSSSSTTVSTTPGGRNVAVSSTIEDRDRNALDESLPNYVHDDEKYKAYIDWLLEGSDKINESLKAVTNRIEVLFSDEMSSGSAGEAQVSEFRAERINVEEELKARNKLEEQINEYRAKLNYETTIRTGKALTAEQAAANEELVRREFKDRVTRLEQLKKREALSKTDLKLAQALEERKADYIARKEYEYRQKHNGKLEVEEAERIRHLAEYEYELTVEMQEKLEKARKRDEKRDHKNKKRSEVAATDQAIERATKLGGFSKEDNLLSRIDSLVDVVGKVSDGEGGKAALAAANVAIKAISSLAKQLDNKIDEIASYQGDIDTRLQGSKNEKSKAGSYWGQLTKDMMSVGAVTPFFKQDDFAKNIKSLVDQGISFDLKQRAFLMTIQEKIANTFNVADGTLLRLIRIQQEDSTAGRLGMESALNSFLNNMYENTEYLKAVADGVRSSLQEMEALMSGAEATEVEYQVQKWMGSLYSVGMSQEAVNSIASALGQIAAGQVDALTNGTGAGNLLVMAANKAGQSIADILTDGLNGMETNQLLQATVDYLADLAESSKDSRVVQQQLASVFGVKASDLRAATNLISSSKDVYGEYMTYDNMLNQLNKMAGSMYLRTSLGEMMTNIWENGQYTLASGMANNPVSYLMFKMADLLEQTTGGISLPFLNVYGFGVDLETTVADLMRVASMSSGILGSLGPMISGLASSFSGQAMLSTMGIEQGSGLKVTPRGKGVGAGDNVGGGSSSTSGSGYVGNANSSDVKDSTIQGAEDDKKQQMIEAKEEAEATVYDMINTNVLKIYELLDAVANGKRSLNVKMEGYGLTSLGGGLQGGVNGLSSDSLLNDSSSGTGAIGGNSSMTSSAVNLGGWTIA